MSVFGDVGSGQTFGQRIVSSADNGQIVEIPLNAAGLAALNNAKGFAFAIGGSLTTLSGQTSTNEIVFGSTNSQHLVSLKLVGGSPNLPPVANAGPDQAVRAGNSVLLNGSGSFDDNTPTASLAYSWSFSSKPLGSSATLIGAATQVPTFFVDVPGTYVVRLVVTDANGLSSEADEVMISSDNLSPTAHAGNDVLVIVGELVTLNGASSTDPEFDALAFSWALTAVPPGSSATLSGATTPTPMFIPDVQGTYAVGLVVSDNLGPSLPDTVIVAATSAQNYAEVQIQDSNAIVTTLPPTSVTTAGNQNALSNFLSQATIAIQSSDLVKARAKLQQAIERTDGCALRGSPDGNGSGRDWITTCSAQIPTYQLLIDALDAIAP